ncbi:hypothetical protein LAZ67_1004328 [Cordylochernes scorpioides]|uniref:Angiotensin-converting enzyme n=1 Tax=Cordylochernes scorpioides TaxID=51811 RepID=A0ABY6JZ57_9ARAC|nr:hypothetical protein LAZ67_1004328 [Cordylochernes scorpioides]
MVFCLLAVLSLAALGSAERYPQGTNSNETEAIAFLNRYNIETRSQCRVSSLAAWKYMTNMTESNMNAMIAEGQRWAVFRKEMWRQATSFAWKNLTDPLVRRQFQELAVLGNAVLPEDKFAEFLRIATEMKYIYSQAKVENLSLDPDLTRIFASSRNAEDLKKYWVGWRDATGKKIRSQYIKFVELSNEAARANGFNDSGEQWRDFYESLTFEDDMAEQWEILRPFYLEMHAYVRMKLVKLYGEEVVKPDGPIPAHLLGNMWGQSWKNLQDITRPFPDKQDVDITPEMVRRSVSEGSVQNVTAIQMFKISEDFFTSLGMKRMTPEFWHYSELEKPEDRAMVCHPMAYNMCADDDFRIKQCTVPTQEDLVTVHHEMGHIQYYQQYANQPDVFQRGANPGSTRPSGTSLRCRSSRPSTSTRSASWTSWRTTRVSSTKRRAGSSSQDYMLIVRRGRDQLPDVHGAGEDCLPAVRLPHRPVALGRLPRERRQPQRPVVAAAASVPGTVSPRAPHRVPGNIPYIRYFFSFILQFQLQEVLCREAGHVGPLHTCDIYGSHAAGDELAALMRLGSSMPWQDALARMTGGSGKLDAGPLLNYFAPLRRHIQGSLGNSTIGWTSGDQNICP